MSQVSPPWSPRTPSTLVLQGKGKVKMSVSPPVSRSTRNSINDDVSDSFSTVPAFHTSPPGTPTGNPSMSYDGSFDSSFDASSGSLQRWSFSDSSKEEPKELSLAGLLAISIGTLLPRSSNVVLLSTYVLRSCTQITVTENLI